MSLPNMEGLLTRKDWAREAARATAAKVRERGTKVGENTRLWGYTDIIFPHLITIGRNCVLASRSALLAHGVLVTPKGGAPVTVGDNCYIGFGAIVLPGVTIGDNCIIGAGAVVPEDIPPNSIAVGNPARVIKQRDPEELKQYIKTRKRDG